MKPILFNDFRAQWSLLRTQVLEAVERVGASGQWILGTELSAFEAELAALFGQPFAIGCASGLDAIEISLRCAGLQAGQRVLTTPLSAFASSLAVIRAGGVPVFADVDDSGLLDLELCASLLTENEDIRFLLPVHLYGHALDRQALSALQERFDLQIIEDCAQSIGARSHHEPVGSVASFTATSFYPTKNLGAMGDGGALLTRSSEGAERARRLRDYGQRSRFDHAELGLNSRLDPLQAAILRLAFLPALADRTTRRREVARAYLEGIDHPAIRPLPAPTGSESVWHIFPVAVSGDREALRAHLEAAGIASDVHYPMLIPEQQAIRDRALEWTLTPLPRAQRLADQELSLPVHPLLSDSEVERVIDACNTWPG